MTQGYDESKYLQGLAAAAEAEARGSEELAEARGREPTMTEVELMNIFTYHAPKGDQASRYEGIRGHALRYAIFIDQICPESREKSLALTAIQQAVMWANASIAIHEP